MLSLVTVNGVSKYGFRYYDRIIPEDWLKEKGKNKHAKFIKFGGYESEKEMSRWNNGETNQRNK